MIDFKPGDKVYTSRYSAQYIVRECVVLKVSSVFVYCKVDNSIVWIHKKDVFWSADAAADDVRMKTNATLRSLRKKIERLAAQLLSGKPTIVRARK